MPVKKLGSISVLSLCSFSAFAANIHTLTPDNQREAIVAEIKQGHFESGIVKLNHLRQRYPFDQKILADYIIVLYQNKRFDNDQLSILKNLNIAQFPQYGQITLVRALRDLKQLSLAQKYAIAFNQHHASLDLQLILGVIQAEAHENEAAKKTLHQINPERLSAEQQAQLAYGYRLLDMPIESLKAANLAIKTEHPSLNIQEQYIYALMLNSDFDKAQAYIQQNNLTTKMPNIDDLVKLREFSQRIRDAIQYAKAKSYQGDILESYTKVDQVISEMQAFEPQLPQDMQLRRAFYYDYIYILNFRYKSQQVLNQVDKLNLPYAQMPPYIRHALADSFSRVNQPKQAEYLYKTLLKEKNYPDFNVYSSLYYALIAQEKYKEANQLILDMDHLLPTFSYSAAKGVDRTTHSDRAEYLSLKGLNYAYQNRLDKAERYFEELVARAPQNIGYQNNLATIQRWREKPLTSQKTLQQFNGIEPISTSTLINQMQNDQALSRIKAWRQQNQVLVAQIPEDTGVILSKKELDDRDHASIQHESLLAKNRSDQTNVLQSLTGSSEYEHRTQINSPWFANNYRVFATLAQREAKYTDENISDHRYGLGLEWANNNRFANVQLTQNTYSSDIGLILNWTQRLNDHWQYGLGFDSYADIPLQAVKQSYEGKSYSAQLGWQANESRKAGLGYQATKINDGNLRHAVVASFDQNIYSNVKHITRLNLRNEYQINSNITASYFNPRHSNSAEVTLIHDWLTWRNMNRQMNQHFEIGTGAFSQADYSTKPLFNVLYRHDWKLSRTWSLNYGIGWSNHPYNEENERRTYAQFGFEGRF